MKTLTQCPHCNSKNVSPSSKLIHIQFALGMAIIGLGLLIPALSKAIGYYLLGFPICITGLLAAYNGINHRIVRGRCRNCNYEFDCILE